MQSKAPTVKQYLDELPPERRAAIEAVRNVILKSLPKGYQEDMGYGMIRYSVPHTRYPAGYHCDPKQPLPFAGLASQKQAMSIYLCTYSDGKAGEARFRAAWDKEVRAGRAKKLDKGVSCIRFKKVEDLALNVISDSIRSLPVDEFIAFYERNRTLNPKGASTRSAARKTARQRSASTQRKAKATRKRSSASSRAARVRK